MSSQTVQKEKTEIIDLQTENEKLINKIFSDITIPFSEILKVNNLSDIYNGNEQMRFNERHPIFKALFKLEFEEALLDYLYKMQT
jgi:hypothetical protein